MSNDIDQRYVNTAQLAQITGIAASSWTKKRLDGSGPVYKKVGRRVLYRMSDVDAWIERCTRQSTSDQ